MGEERVKMVAPWNAEMELAFDHWWNDVALPGIQQSPASFLLMRHIAEIKEAEKNCWAAAWQAAKGN